MLRGLESMNARANTYLDDISGYPDDANPAAAVAEVLTARGYAGKRVAIDQNAWFLTVNLHQRLVKEFGPLLDASGLVEELRRVKSPLELRQMEEAARANDAGMQAGLEATRAGASENDVAAAIMAAAVKAGSEYVGMEPFVTSGPRSGIPHTTWRRRRIEPGDVVILETSACYNRYHAALYRTVAIGKIPDRARDMYRVCEEGLAAAIAELRPGRTCADVHQAAQAVVDRHGYTFGYRKRTGYSIGISFAPDWGEGNILSLYRGVDVTLAPGMVFHVPITLREYAQWTVAVSETVAGHARGRPTAERAPGRPPGAVIRDVFLVQPIHDAGVERLRAAGLGVRQASRADMATVAAEIGAADAVVTRNAGLSAAAIDAAPRLRLIVVHGVGHDPVDVAHAAARGIVVCNTPVANAWSVAEHAIALLLALAKQTLAADQRGARGSLRRPVRPSAHRAPRPHPRRRGVRADRARHRPDRARGSRHARVRPLALGGPRTPAASRHRAVRESRGAPGARGRRVAPLAAPTGDARPHRAGRARPHEARRLARQHGARGARRPRRAAGGARGRAARRGRAGRVPAGAGAGRRSAAEAAERGPVAARRGVLGPRARDDGACRGGGGPAGGAGPAASPRDRGAA